MCAVWPRSHHTTSHLIHASVVGDEFRDLLVNKEDGGVAWHCPDHGDGDATIQALDSLSADNLPSNLKEGGLLGHRLDLGLDRVDRIRHGPIRASVDDVDDDVVVG